MAIERCGECGFDGGTWTDGAVVEAIAQLPQRWRSAAANLDRADARRRPLPGTWSIAEYADHVREVLCAMRFVLDSAVAQPGVDLGESPAPVFDPEPRDIDLGRALAGIAREAGSLHQRLTEMSSDAWDRTAVVDGDAIDARWICRHAVHDASHHLMDVERLRATMPNQR